ncbi:ATP-binding cassette domain-containing protein [Candidatus Neomarinimicrobiota bacterium]
MLRLLGVWKNFPSNQSQFNLKDCNQQFNPSTIYTIFGESGVGKTTLLRCLNNLDSVSQGQILLDGEDIESIPPASVRRRVSLLFQTPSFVGKTVRENFEFAARCLAVADFSPEIVLDKVQLKPDVLDRAVESLSVGQQQRACLARLLIGKPQVLLLDEPTAALDDPTSLRILEIIKDLAGENSMTVIMVTHRREHAAYLGGTHLCLSNGQLELADK